MATEQQPKTISLNGKEIETKGGIHRAIEGEVKEPKDATKEMKFVAKEIITNLLKQRCISGWFGDKSHSFVTDQINLLLRDFVKFKVTGERCHQNYISSHAHNLQKHVHPRLLNRYATLSGYELKWVPLSCASPEGDYPRFSVNGLQVYTPSTSQYDEIFPYEYELYASPSQAPGTPVVAAATTVT